MSPIPDSQTSAKQAFDLGFTPALMSDRSSGCQSCGKGMNSLQSQQRFMMPQDTLAFM